MIRTPQKIHLFNNTQAGSYSNALSLIKWDSAVQNAYPGLLEGMAEQRQLSQFQKLLKTHQFSVRCPLMWQASSRRIDPEGRGSDVADTILSAPHSEQDQFLEDRPKQPKKAVADYLDTQGILVPEIFSSFKTALASGKDFIIRSEHPQEYDGVSGLMQSYSVTQKIIELCRNRDVSAYPKLYKLDQTTRIFYSALSEMIHGEIDEGTFFQKLARATSGNISFYCDFHGISESEFYAEVSFTYWEKIPGQNISISEDTAVQGRYHIINVSGSIHSDGDALIDASNAPKTIIYTYEKGKIHNEMVRCEISPENLAHAQSLVDLYEKVRTLPKFSKDHCPILEIQSTPENVLYVLQSHRGRDRQMSADFKIQNIPENEGVVQATFVRGALQSDEPVELKLFVGVYYFHPRFNKWGFQSGVQNSHTRSFMSRDLDLTIIGTHLGFGFNPLDYMSIRMDSPHEMFATLLKPRLSVVVDFQDKARLTKLSPEELEQVKLEAEQTGKAVSVYTSVYVVSDGTKAYLFKK